MKSKKGQAIEGLRYLIPALVGVGIVLAVGFLIIAQVKTQATTLGDDNSSAVNATEKVQAALDDIPGWLPIIIVTVIGALLLGLVSMFRGAGSR